MTRADTSAPTDAARQMRLSPADALALLQNAPTAELMRLADQARTRRHGPNTYFVHSLNINPTNICENECELCAFWRAGDAEDAYSMDLPEACRHMAAAVGDGLTEVHIVGGLTEKTDLAYYEALIAAARRELPGALVQGITAVEVHYLAKRDGLSVSDVLARLKAAGLGAMPGGGAEIFAPRVREKICSNKISADDWLAVHEQAHAIGLPTNATVLFGHIESPADIIDHMSRLRDLQDHTGGFQAFIPLPFHPAGTKFDDLAGPGGHTIVRTVAIGRMFMDNFPHVRVLANYLDRKLLGILTRSGADDVGGTSIAERIARAAGAPASHAFASPAEMAEFLTDLHLQPVLVNSAYQPAEPPADEQDAAPQAIAQYTEPQPADEVPSRARDAIARAAAGERLSAEDAIVLHDDVPLQQLGLLAHSRRLQACNPNTATFVLDRNISITNVCEAGCKFCAFHVAPGSPDSFTLTIEQIVEKVTDATKLGATQILLQGGLNPELDLAFYERMLTAVKQAGDVCVHSLSPAEITYIARGASLSITETLERLRAAGLDSLPGGGAEILVDEVRNRVSPRKVSADQWLAVMLAAQQLGMKTTATMVYGLGETTAQRAEHLTRIRDLQDRTGGFTAFIPWSFQPNRTQISLKPANGLDYLRVLALGRLVLDNIPHVQAGWVTEGPDVAQLALSFGADDFGGVLMEESVVRATGVTYSVTRDQVVRLIGEAGFTPAKRSTQYEILHVYE